MSKPRDKKARPLPSIQTAHNNSGPEAARVHELIAGKHSKTAVEVAKEFHKRAATAESEILLITAYEARIRDLLHIGMSVEAKSLLNLVGERFPSAHARLEDLGLELRAGGEDLDELVGPLRNPDLAQSVREKIETLIRQRVENLSLLAQVSSLPSTHPLREGAAAVVVALRAVTSGPVEDGVLLLPQIPRRSLLASWKALVNAIAGFYRGQDELCEKWLAAIVPDSVPARLVPPLRAMLGAAPPSTYSAPATRLLSAVGSSRKLLQVALVSLEQAIGTGKKKPVLERARVAVSLCRDCCPEILDKLRKHIAVRCMLLAIEPVAVSAAIGSWRDDAYWYRLMALSLEASGSIGHAHGQACWERFRQCAIQENWFKPNSLEDGVLSLHMAQSAGRIPADELENLVSPGQLYERACKADPHPDAFQKWLKWAKKQKDWRAADHVAELWRQARSQDVEPLLWLMESAEERGAFKKSLNFLEEAEQLDHLNPEVRKFKLRLLTAGVIRHLGQRKAHLAAQGIDRMASLPEARDGNLSPVVRALRFVCSTLSDDLAGAKVCETELEEQLGSAGAYLLRIGIANAARLAPQDAFLQPVDIAGVEVASLLKGVSRACALGNLVGMPLTFPSEWMQLLTRAIAGSGASLDIVQLLGMGESALHSYAHRLAFAISAEGLARGGADARFMFLRARALPLTASERRSYCLGAALELARRERNPELAGNVLDQLMYQPRRGFAGNAFMDTAERDNFSLEPKLLNEVLEKERKNLEFPTHDRNPLPNYARQTPRGSNRPGRDRAPDETDCDDDDDDDWDNLDELMENVPPEVLAEVLAAMSRGETIDRFEAGKASAGNVHEVPSRPRTARKQTPPRAPQPHQETLF